MRASAQRLTAKDFIKLEHRQGIPGFQLTSRAQAILANADRRIFNPRTASPDHGWVLAIFSVPESHRSDRHLLRSRLEWLGFGRVANGVWIAPDHNEADLRSTLADLSLEQYVTTFKAQTVDLPSIHGSIKSWWDLNRIEDTYRNFILEVAPITDYLNTSDEILESWAFTTYVNVLTLWRRLPFFDPGLSDRYLPSPWAGYRAFDAFMLCHEMLEPLARQHVHQTWETEFPQLD